MQTLGDMAKTLNRSAVYLAGLQKRFDLPTFEGAAYSAAYLAFLRSVIALRTFNIAEDTLIELWHFERKLLQVLHVDSTGSKTWFLDACGLKSHPRRRLLLTNYDIGVALPSRTVQLGLNFEAALPELFAGKEMGEDALRVLAECLRRYTRIQTDVNDEVPLVRAASLAKITIALATAMYGNRK